MPWHPSLALLLCHPSVPLPSLCSSARKLASNFPRQHSVGKRQPGTLQCALGWVGSREVPSQQRPGLSRACQVSSPARLPGPQVSRQGDSPRAGFVSTRSPQGPHFQPLCSLESLRAFLKGQKEISLLLFPKSDFETFKSPASPKCCYFLLLIHEVPCYPHMSMTFLS